MATPQFWTGLGKTILNGVLGLGFGSAQGAINNYMTDQMNDKNAERNQKYWEKQLGMTYTMNEKAADNAMKRSLDMYNLTQSPEAMVKQLKTAGLNPALMYSNSGMGGHTQQGAQGGVSGASGTPNPLGLQNFVDPLTIAQIKNLDADTDKKKAETANEKLTSATIKLENQLKEIQIQLDNNNLTFSNETLQTSIDNVKLNTQKAIEEVREKRRNNEIGDATMKSEIERIRQTATNTIIEGEMMLWQTEQIKAITENTNVDTEKKQAEIKKIKQETAMFRQTLFKLINETNHELYKIENTKKLTAYYEKLTDLGEKEFQAKYGNDWNKQDWFNLADVIIKGIMAGLGMYVGTARVGQTKQQTTNVGGYQYTTP